MVAAAKVAESTHQVAPGEGATGGNEEEALELAAMPAKMASARAGR